MREGEIETAVSVEAESFIPLPINQVYLDWQTLSTKEDKMEILIVASPRNFIDGYLNIFDEAKLDVWAMEVESQSCHRALIPNKSEQTSLIVDIDSFRTSLIMVENGNLQFTSSIPLAGNSFTDSIAKFLGVSGQKAELIKRTAGLANTSEYPNLRLSVDSLVKSLSAEIKNIIKFHSEHSNRKVENLILAGGGAKAKNLPEILSNEFVADQIRVELGDPFVNLANLNSPPVAKFEALNFTTAIGLALRNIYENN
jgi:type IV pilus assembly protein PilM